jgi:hypothetical protein
VERSKVASITRRIEQVVEVLGRKPLALVFVDTIRGETNEQAVARYVADRPEHADADFLLLRWRRPSGGLIHVTRCSGGKQRKTPPRYARRGSGPVP